MSVNKFMHPRNLYRKPPDFKSLAIKYPEFRKYAKQDLSGKVKLDFKNLESVQALTYTLLKEDFKLDVEIPLNRLIPTLPLRLNYLLWIEDILDINKITTNIRGIDIGCGASCVYPLLAAKHFHWTMLATEKDSESAHIALKNVKNNHLEEMITVKIVEEGNILQDILDTDTTYDFSMCNPPFFSCLDELSPGFAARSPNRPLPRNAHSGAPGELVVSGGEVAFVKHILEDSVKLKTQIRIYTVMVGHKASVRRVCKDLKEAGVTRLASTEFHQGHTTRWGIAWSMDPEIILPDIDEITLCKKKKTPFTHTCTLDLASTVNRLRQLMHQLQITYSILVDNSDMSAMEICALRNTWSNSRRKRRQDKSNRLQQKSECGEEPPTCDSTKEANEITLHVENAVSGSGKRAEGMNNNDLHRDNCESVCTGIKRPAKLEDDCSDSRIHKSLKVESACSVSTSKPISDPLLYSSLIVRRHEDCSVIELSWLRGVGGKDAAHQVLQYFKNNINAY